MNTQTMSKRHGDSVEKMAERPSFAPPVDIYENKDEIIIFADIPGVAQEGLTVNLDKDRLTIEAHRAATGGERAFDYARQFVVPRGIDAERIAASLQNGVLKLTLPKSAAMKPRQITVNTG